jgi:uncharacterized membrane protein (DUF485 family)
VVTPLTTDAHDSTTAEKYLAVQRSDEFARLRKTLRGFIFPMTIAFFLWYALYVLLSAYARGFMGVKLIGNINVALVLGLLQFVTTFLIAWLYSRFAARKVDPLADTIAAELRADAGSGPAAGTGTGTGTGTGSGATSASDEVK